MSDIISREEFNVVDLLSEGPIEGPVDKNGKLISERSADLESDAERSAEHSRLIYESIYLNDVPVKQFNKNEYNFRYISTEYRAGLNEGDGQTQPAFRKKHFSSQSANLAKNVRLIGHVAGTVDDSTPLGFQESLDNGAIPFTHYIKNPDVDNLIITLSTTLSIINDKGDSVDARADIGIRAQIQGQDTIYGIDADSGLIYISTNNTDTDSDGTTSLEERESIFGQNTITDIITPLPASDSVKIQGYSQAAGKVSFKLGLKNIIGENAEKAPIILKFVKLHSEKFNENNKGRTTRDIRINYITEQISEKLNYPNAAVMGLTIDSRGFSQEPTRTYDLKLLKVKVPSNYTPWKPNETTQYSTLYTNVWDGTFSDTLQWTCNPAWIFYDLLTNKRYGLGRYGVKEEHVDKWALYEIARYCDAVNENGQYVGVPTGFGGSDEYGGTFPALEPRFTCNIILNQKQDALELLQNFASIFNGLVYWGFGSLAIVSDMPKEPVAIFTDSDVAEDGFNYSDSAKASRVTVVKVRYNDQHDHFKPKIEYKDDVAGIQKYGIIEQETIAFGCTSRGQAQRMAKWLLYSNLLQKETISFITGLRASYLRPGDIISIQDSLDNPKNLAGRISQVDYTAGTIKLDIPILEISLPCKISFMLSSPSSDSLTAYTSEEAESSRPSLIHEAYATSIDSNRTEITIRKNEFSEELPDFMHQIQPGSTWIISDIEINSELEIKKYKIMSVAEKEPGKYAVVGLEYIDDKFDIVDEDANINIKDYGLQDTELFPNPKISSPTITGEQITVERADGSQRNRLEVTLYQVAEQVDYYEVQFFQDGLPRQHVLGGGIKRISYDPNIAAGQPYPTKPRFNWPANLRSEQIEIKAYAVKDGVYSSDSNDRDGIYT